MSFTGKLASLFLPLPLLMCFAGCGSGTQSLSPQGPCSLSFGSLNEDYVNWYGRCRSDGESVDFSNASAGFEVTFTGTRLTATIVSAPSSAPQEAAGNPYVYIFKDGVTHYSRAVHMELDGCGIPAQYVLAESLDYGKHTVKVLKCTEAKYGEAALLSLETDGTFTDPPKKRDRKMELIGDSIMCGSECMRESTTADSKLSVSENSLASYGYLAADLLNCRVNTVSRSGALVSGYKGYASIPDYYDRYGQTDPEPWDFERFRPDIVILDLGTNDVIISAPQEMISEKYLAFLRHVRKKNPGAAIFCCAGALVTSVNGVVEQAVNTVRSEGDENVWFFRLPVLTTAGHPKEQAHLENSYALALFIMEMLGWEPEL